MKLSISITLSIGLFLAFAQQSAMAHNSFVREGHFVYSHEAKLELMNQADCEAEHAKWDGNNCIGEVKDTVTTIKGIEGYVVNIFTRGYNHTYCEFNSQTSDVSQNSIVATTNITGTTCTVRVNFNADGSVSTKALKACKQLCGNDVTLNIEGAK